MHLDQTPISGSLCSVEWLPPSVDAPNAAVFVSIYRCSLDRLFIDQRQHAFDD